MKYLPSLFLIILLLSPIFISNNISAQEPTLEVELSIVDERDDFLVEFGEEETIDLRFVQSGFNWTKLSEGGFFFSKIYLPIMFYSLKFLLGYNSVVFNASIVGNPSGWQAWVSPNSVTYFTGESTADLKLHVKVSRPTNINTAIIRVAFQAYGGNNEPIGKATTDVQVSIKQYHIAQITAIEQAKEVKPDSITTFPVEVTNLGNYQDTYAFTITNETNGFMGVISGFLTLEPGETGQISAVISSPYTFLYDFGSKTSLNISAYSIYDSSKQFTTMVQITSRGFYFSEPFIASVISILLIIITFYFLYNYITDKRQIENNGKPVKPWNIPIEKQYLHKLKKEDPEKYDQILKMMKEEYQSALFWYKDNRDYNKTDKNSIKSGIKYIKDFFSRPKDDVIQELDNTDENKEKPQRKKSTVKTKDNKNQTTEEKSNFVKSESQFIKNKLKSLFTQSKKTEDKKIFNDIKKEKTVRFQEVSEEIQSLNYDSNGKKLREKTLEKIKRNQIKQRKKL